MDIPIYALDEDEAYKKISDEHAETVLQEIEACLVMYAPATPEHIHDGIALYELHNTSSYQGRYEMYVKNDIIVQLVKHVDTRPVLVVKGEGEFMYSDISKNGKISLDALKMIRNYDDKIERLYDYFHKSIIGKF